VRPPAEITLSTATSATLPDLPDGLPLPQRYWAMLVIALAIVLAVLDSSIANVALPTIAHTLHADAASSIWIVNAYQLAIVVSLLPLSSLGEIIGYRRIYLAGLALFTVASLGCALSDSLLTLTLARTIQGFGAAGVMSVNIALVRLTFPQHMLGRGISLNASVVAISTAIGPSIASAILAVAHWPWLFAVNVPLGLAAYTIGRWALPASAIQPRRFDIPSAILNALTFGLLIVTVDGFSHGESRALVAAAIVATVTLIASRLTAPADFRPIDRHLGMFFHRANAGLCIAAVLLSRHLGLKSGPDRLADDAMAFSDRGHRPDLRLSVGSLFSGSIGRHRTSNHGAEPSLAGNHAGAPANHRDCLAYGVVRLGLWLIPIAQQPGHTGCRAASPQRWRERHVEYRAHDGPKSGRGAGGADL